MTGIIFASDHAGYDYKQELMKFVKNMDIVKSYVDCGTTSSTESVDYPDYIHGAIELRHKSTEKTICVLVCGSANDSE